MMSWIRVNDIFEELSEENKRLSNELLFANKCLNVLNKIKTFIDFNCNKLKTNLDSNESQNFDELLKEVKEIFEEKESHSNHQIINENQLSVTKELPTEPKIKSIVLKKKMAKISFKKSKSIVNKAIQPIKTSKNSNLFAEFEDNSNEPNFTSNNISKEPIKVMIKQEMAETQQPVKSKNTTKRKRYRNKDNYQFICDYIGCDKKYFSRDSLRNHYKKHFKPVKCLTCDVVGCDYKTRNKTNLEQHMNNHRGIKPYVCSFCGKGFTSQKLLAPHIQRLHTVSEQPIVCEICHKTFKNEFQFTDHQKMVHIYEKKNVCDYPNCGYKSLSRAQLESHKKEMHSIERPYKCIVEACLKTFKRSRDLETHMTVHSTERNFKCTHEGCHKTFKNRDNLRVHLQNVHSNVKIPCDWPGCDYETKSERSLRSHRTVHISERKFICEFTHCRKAFKKKNQLLIHLRIHNNDKRYACHWPGCQYRCTDSGNIIKHSRVHQKNH